ncbi:zona pellucida-like domain protein [Necator americanus]|uniref:Zona pellucida-like domain protein n=1 Tax=Necator americanus TaxID=51031 RepID=W2SRC2_NECAM|nr:zona pellucida-like domain protein [Necator americanus]ETN72073.1 zona pellucida-like domain protein [Necator americanus]
MSEQSEDFDNAKILGLPRLICSKKSLTFDIETNIPFQGRISVMKKIHRQACVRDYSENIQRNATFKIELQHCMELTYLNNGTRVFSAQIEVGFHPLVITSNDRLFSVKCIDNSHAVAHIAAKKEDNHCTHTVRLASRWESGTVFHVGDAVVHEWNCNFSCKEDQKYQTFLTNCNVLSNDGQTIHLVDENGCIVDSELMGEIVYNNFMPKIFARARMFKLMNDEKYRIECQVQMCTTDGVCKDRIFPPKCAFTKEEILSRYMAKPKPDSIEDTIMTGTINNQYERQVKVVSEWITVHNNQYTNIELLNERYYLTTIMNDKMEEPKIQQPMRHFLMGISYRNPKQNETEKDESTGKDGSPIALIHPSPSFRPDSGFADRLLINGLSETDDGEETNASGMSEQNVGDSTPVILESESSSTKTTTNEKRELNTSVVKDKSTQSSTITTTTKSSTSTNRSSSKIGSKPNTTISRLTTQKSKNITTPSASITSNKAATTSKASSTKQTSWRGSRSSTAKPFPKEDIIGSSDQKRFSISPCNYGGSEGALFQISRQKLDIDKTEEVTIVSETSVSSHTDGGLNTVIKEKFANLRDWRLDDRTINDTDILPERQVACTNATIIATPRKCSWSGIEHLLVIWSFASLLVWIVMIAICFYRQANKPTWVEFRERELQRMAQSRVLQHDHPWIHADAFEETRSVPWLVRKMISGKMQKGRFLIKRDGDEYIYDTGNAARDLQYRFKLGETFTDTGYDGKQHKTCEAKSNGNSVIWKREFAKKI